MIKHFFTPYVVLEIAAAYFFIHAYGFLNLVLEVIASAVLGLFFMFRVGFFQLTSNIAFFKPSDVFSSVGMAIGGFFMFIPGLITDVLGAAIVAAVAVVQYIIAERAGLMIERSMDDVSRTSDAAFNPNSKKK